MPETCNMMHAIAATIAANAATIAEVLQLLLWLLLWLFHLANTVASPIMH